MSGKNKVLRTEIFEGTIDAVTVNEKDVVTYTILKSLDSPPLTGALPLKQSKDVFSRYKNGDTVVCIKYPKSNGGLYILGGYETEKDNPPEMANEDYSLDNDFGTFSISNPSKNGLCIDQSGSGIKLNTYNEDSSQTFYSDNHCFYNSSGFSYFGKAKVVFDERDTDSYLSNNHFNKYGFNFDYFKNDAIGEYGGGEHRVPGLLSPFRNKPMVYSRSVYNHMPNNWQGSDLEYSSLDAFSDSVSNKEVSFRNINSRTNFSYNLDLGPNQIGEVIWGNVFDLDGYSVDSNYKKLKNYKPTNKDLYFQDHELKRRGIAYHFQVSTNFDSSWDYSPNDNFLTSINKEGFLYLNVPATSSTGIIPFQKEISFNDNPFSKSRISSKSISPESEDVPVVNHVIMKTKYKDGSQTETSYDKEECIPKILKIDSFERETGVGVSELNSHNIGGSEPVSRIKMTKYHNMYSAAETLFANKIKKVNIPLKDSSDCNMQTGNSYYKSFEIPIEHKVVSGSGDTNIPMYMSSVVTKSGMPAIQTGGGVPVCGLSAEEINHKPLTNSFYYKDEKIIYPEGTERFGGVSSLMNFEGSITASIGKDIHDEKSIMLDCAGSMICWLGKDKNSRSAVVQTDGSVSLSVGGRSGGTFHKGRLDIRVNVSDKGTLEEANDSQKNKRENSNGDYIISISEHGLVIAGMNNSPMVIRNSGDLCIDSGGDIKIMAAGSIIKKEGFSEQSNSGENQNATTDKVSGYCDLASLLSSLNE